MLVVMVTYMPPFKLIIDNKNCMDYDNSWIGKCKEIVVTKEQIFGDIAQLGERCVRNA